MVEGRIVVTHACMHAEKYLLEGNKVNFIDTGFALPKLFFRSRGKHCTLIITPMFLQKETENTFMCHT